MKVKVMSGNKQERTSANTSINKTKLPAAFSKFRPHGHICDYGCGKYVDHIREHCDYSGALSYNPYDKYNQDFLRNEHTAHFGENHGYDMIYCCNVLNVIDSLDTIDYIIAQMYTWCDIYGRIIIQIYEGNKTGIGKESKYDCWQRNEPTMTYVRRIRELLDFCNAPYEMETMQNFIVIRKLPGGVIK